MVTDFIYKNHEVREPKEKGLEWHAKYLYLYIYAWM